jgi:hypothetical protein
VTQYLPQTRRALRQHVGRMMDKLTVGTALGGTRGTVTLDAAKRYPDTHFAGRALSVVQGAAAGQIRVVTSAVQQDGVLFVEPDFTAPVAGGDIVEIWDEDLHPDRVNNALNLAILDAQEIVQVRVRVNPTAISPDRLELTLPDDITKVYGVGYQEPGKAAVIYQGVELTWPAEYPSSWTVVGRSLFLTPAPPEAVTLSDAWIEGYRCPVLLETDSDVAEVRPDFLIYLAGFLLESGEIGSQVVDPTQHGPRAASWLRQALVVRDRMSTAWEPNTVEVGP